jgi:hypothetical protein
MLTLAEQQQSLLRILCEDTEPLPTDPWLSEVIHSPGLVMIREIAAWWLRFQIESQCRLTSRLMKRMGSFDDYLAAHARQNSIPQPIEELTRQFLTSLTSHPDQLLRAVAAFEQACLTPSDAHQPASTTTWDRNPNTVLTALSQCTELPAPEPGAEYTLTLEPDPTNPVSPRKITCTRQVTSV